VQSLRSWSSLSYKRYGTTLKPAKAYQVRRSVRGQVLVHARGEMSACFAYITSITAWTRKFIHNARTEPVRESIFHVEQVLKFKGRINKFDVDGFAESIDQLAHPLLCNTRKMPDVGDLEIVLGHLLFLDTCWRLRVVPYYCYWNLKTP